MINVEINYWEPCLLLQTILLKTCYQTNTCDPRLSETIPSSKAEWVSMWGGIPWPGLYSLTVIWSGFQITFSWTRSNSSSQTLGIPSGKGFDLLTLLDPYRNSYPKCLTLLWRSCWFAVKEEERLWLYRQSYLQLIWSPQKKNVQLV